MVLKLANDINIDGSLISSSFTKLKRQLEEFEDALIDLDVASMFARDELKGLAYTNLFETVDQLINEQREVMVFVKVVYEEMEAYLNDMKEAERKSRNKFSV